jgi:hypothetical protein
MVRPVDAPENRAVIEMDRDVATKQRDPVIRLLKVNDRPATSTDLHLWISDEAIAGTVAEPLGNQTSRGGDVRLAHPP